MPMPELPVNPALYRVFTSYFKGEGGGMVEGLESSGFLVPSSRVPERLDRIHVDFLQAPSSKRQQAVAVQEARVANAATLRVKPSQTESNHFASHHQEGL